MPSTNGSAADQLSSLHDALDDFKRGQFLLVLDDLDRENEGDLICAAASVTTEQMAFLIRHSSGYVCCAMSRQRLEELQIPMMLENNTERHKTAYTHTVDYSQGTTTGISAHDRALTARKLADLTTKPKDFGRPGHMVPLRAVDGGVHKRKGHTEAAVDLCRLSGLPEAGIICELVKPDDPSGSMAKRDDCIAFGKEHGIKVITIEDLAAFRRETGQ